MRSDLFNFIKDAFSSVWDLFLIKIPGTGISFAALGVAALIISFSWSIFGHALNWRMPDLRGVSGGNNSKKAARWSATASSRGYGHLFGSDDF